MRKIKRRMLSAITCRCLLFQVETNIILESVLRVNTEFEHCITTRVSHMRNTLALSFVSLSCAISLCLAVVYNICFGINKAKYGNGFFSALSTFLIAQTEIIHRQ